MPKLECFKCGTVGAKGSICIICDKDGNIQKGYEYICCKCEREKN